MSLELCCYNEHSARLGAELGVSRIELCEQALMGGLTPDISLTKRVVEHVKVPVYVMIRPRAGNFHYSTEEFLQMKTELVNLKRAGVQGFVTGMLLANKTIDRPRCLELLELAYPLPCTFHRAFDEVLRPFAALEVLARLGFTRILTSGQKASALKGKTRLKELVRVAGREIIIVPGGGIRAENIAEIAETSAAREYHSSALICSPSSPRSPGLLKTDSALAGPCTPLYLPLTTSRVDPSATDSANPDQIKAMLKFLAFTSAIHPTVGP